MAKVRPVQEPMFEEIYAELLQSLAPELGAAEWHRIFDFPWPNPEELVGYALYDEADRPVGFAGLIFAEVPVGDGCERLCNVTSWTVKESHRSQAMSLVLPVLRRKGYTITNLTSIPAVNAIFSRLGFEVLETHRCVVFTLPSLRVLLGRAPCRVTTNPAEIEGRLASGQRRIFRDHRDVASHLLAYDDDSQCYVVYTRAHWRALRSGRLHYVSDAERFQRWLRAIQWQLLRREAILVLEFDERLAGRPHTWLSFRRALPTPRLFRSSSLSAGQVPNLYSEMVLLNL